MKNFEKFTNLYELSKTLRFELKATDEKTKEIIDIKNFEEDILIKNNRKKLFFYIDELLLLYIKELFSNKHLKNISFDDFFEEYKTNKKDKKNAKYEKKNLLVEQISALYNTKINISGLPHSLSYEDFLKENILAYIKILYIGEKEESDYTEEDMELLDILNLFHGNFTTIGDFVKNRKETVFSHKGKLKKGSILQRIIDENLTRFFDNKIYFESIFELFENGELDFIDAKYAFTKGEKDFFKLDFYKHCFLQSGIDVYNEEIGKLKSRLNHISQEIKNENKRRKKEDSSEKNIFQPKVNGLKVLDKQVLGKVEKQNVEFEIKSNEELFEKIQFLFSYHTENNIKNLIKHIVSFLKNTKSLGDIFLTKRAVETFSGKIFDDFNFLKQNLSLTSNKKFKDFYTLEDINKGIEKFEKSNINIDKISIFKKKYQENIQEQNNIFSYFLKIITEEMKEKFGEFEESHKDFGNFLKGFTDISKIQTEKNVEKIQNYTKNCLDIYRMISYFLITEIKDGDIIFLKKNEENSDFYRKIHLYYDENPIVSYFNQFRNFITKKAYSTEKININFGTNQFLLGWQDSKGKGLQYKGAILRDEEKYFLCVLKKPKLLSVDEAFEVKTGEDFYEFMEYKQLIWGNNIIKTYSADFGKYTASQSDSPEVVANFKKVLKKFEYNFPEVREIIEDETLDTVDKIKEKYDSFPMYKVHFKKVSKSYVENNSELFLFQIYSKDFSDMKKENSKVNQQTNYFLGLFDEKNIQNLDQNEGKSIFKLNGGANVFFREKTNNLPKRKDNQGKEVTQNRRFSENKLLFHFPMTINTGKHLDEIDDFNKKFNKELIENNKIQKIIGLDRGEKHLLYLNLIDLGGKILLSKTLNLVGKDKNGNPVDYKKKLEKIEIKRLEQRKTWKEISEIKNIKEGYISQVVKEICDLAIKENAIIVMEDLSLDFKNNRKSIERQVYSKFEKALLKKLSYFVDKNGEYSDYRNGLQLVPNIDGKTEKQLDFAKQLGIVFYVNPGYTSQTCPNCNFVRDIYLKYKSLEKSIEIIENISIQYQNDEFIFTIKDKNLIFYTGIEKLIKSRKNTEKMWRTVEVNPTKDLKDIFEKYSIDIGKDISEQVIEKNKKNLYEDIFRMINNLLSIRNSETEREAMEKKKENPDYIGKDFISCPVCKYHSEKKENISESGKTRHIERLEDADANGAYNIARKGVIVLSKIKEQINQEKKDLFINIKDWNNFLQKNKKSV